MKTIGTIALALTAALALSACDPYTAEKTGPGQILSVFTASQSIEAVEGTPSGSAWTITGVDPGGTVKENSLDDTQWPVVWVRFDKLLDGFSIQSTAVSCLPAASLNLTVTPANNIYTLQACAAGSTVGLLPPAGPKAPIWFACYVPNTAVTTEGAGVVFYQGCNDISATGGGYNDRSTRLHFGGDYRIVASVKDKQARSYPIDITLQVNPELAVAEVTATAPASTTVEWTPNDSVDFLGTATFLLERADNVPTTATPPVDAPGRTWTTVAGAGALAGNVATFTDTTTAAATKYWYRVTSTGPNGLSRTSDPASNIPGRPTVSFPVAGVAQTSLLVRSTRVALAVNYTVERAPNVAGTGGAADTPGTFQTVGTVAQVPVTDPPTFPELVDTGLTANTKYWYRVTANAGNGLTTRSANASRTTAP